MWGQDNKKQETVQKEQPASAIVLTVAADSSVRVQNAEPGSQMEVYNIVGVKLSTILIDSTDTTVVMNLPKGYYIFKIGNIVRKVVIR